ncbi:MAG: hypothetical protein Greene041679_349 [Parcubacteria group bacterium Greene0416_79]|nr:MAG: hypothetical protein Greene041679_349 [Parcubacteria group bacterium Greene0416_79]
MTPPDKTPSVILKIRLLHKELYTIGHKLSKRDKLGIHASVEKCCLELFSMVIAAAFTHRQDKNKIVLLKTARVRCEMLANLMRTEHELGIIAEETYLHISSQMVGIGKDLNGWITYQTQKKS